MKSMSNSARLTFPEDEAVHPWLALLLEACHITNQGLCGGIRRRGTPGQETCLPACLCGLLRNANHHSRLPAGTGWNQLVCHRKTVRGTARDDIWSIHPQRPMACRQFNVFDRVCAEGEDAWYSHRRDVLALTPLKPYTNPAIDVMLPCYGIEK